MTLITSKELTEKHGISYDRLRHMVKTKRVSVISYLPAVAGQGRVGLYQDDAKVKIKVASAMFPFRFIALRMKGAKPEIIGEW